MAYVMVFFVALVAGAAVYWLTLRAGGVERAYASDGDGFMPPPPLPAPSSIPASAPSDVWAEDRAYVPMIADRHSWQTRTIGVVGLVIAITLAAALLAFSLYQAGAMVAHMISNYAS
ncbi:MAG: hypothetical protein ACXVEI_07145 [Actinomycetota bacterium]